MHENSKLAKRINSFNDPINHSGQLIQLAKIVQLDLDHLLEFDLEHNSLGVESIFSDCFGHNGQKANALECSQLG